MNYTKADLRKFFLAGRRFGLKENEEKTTMDFNKFFDVYSQIQEDIKDDQRDHLTEMMETDAKNGMYDQHKEQWKGWIDMKRIEEMKKRDEDNICLTKGTTTTDFLGRPADQIFTETDIADAIYISKISGKSTYEIIQQLKERKWPKSK